MDRFKKALKIKNSALSIFDRAKKGLSESIDRFRMLQEDAALNIDLKAQEIEKEKEAMDFADAQIAIANSTLIKINNILGGV